MIDRSRIRIPAGAAGEFSSLGSTFCADSYFGIRSTPVLPQQHVKDPGHSAKSAGGRLKLNTRAPYYVVCICMKGRDMVHGCMVYTERAEMAAVSRGISHVTTTQRCGYCQKQGIKCDCHSLNSELHIRQECCSRAENRAIHKKRSSATSLFSLSLSLSLSLTPPPPPFN